MHGLPSVRRHRSRVWRLACVRAGRAAGRALSAWLHWSSACAGVAAASARSISAGVPRPSALPAPAPGTRACSAVLGSAPSAALTPTESTPEPATSLACGSVSRSLVPARASYASTRARIGVTGSEAPPALSVAARLCTRGFAGPVALPTSGPLPLACALCVR